MCMFWHCILFVDHGQTDPPRFDAKTGWPQGSIMVRHHHSCYQSCTGHSQIRNRKEQDEGASTATDVSWAHSTGLSRHQPVAQEWQDLSKDPLEPAQPMVTECDRCESSTANIQRPGVETGLALTKHKEIFNMNSHAIHFEPNSICIAQLKYPMAVWKVRTCQNLPRMILSSLQILTLSIYKYVTVCYIHHLSF